jgi:RHS repeat-associated protein
VNTTRGTIRVLRVWCVLAVLCASARVAQAGWCGSPVPPCELSNPSSPCYRPKPPDPRCEPRRCGKCTKSPCFVGSGAYVAEATDLQLPTPGFALVLSRSYESTHAIDGPLGYGWTSSLAARLYYATYLLAAPDIVKREVDITMPDGGRYQFVENPDGSFTPPLGRYDTLLRNPDSSFDLTPQRTSSRLHFGPDGSLLSMIDEFGNQIRLNYDANGRLQRVEDMAGSGRYFDVYWGADGRISTIQDSAGRQVSYAYSSSGVLTDVTDPLGRTSTYSYVAGKYVPLLAAARDPWSRLLTEVTYDPQDRVTSYTEEGERYSYFFNYQGNPAKTAKVDSIGNTWVYTHGAGGLVLSGVAPGGLGTEATTYYADGLVQQETDEVGVKTFYTYDGQGRLLSTTRDYLGPQAVRVEYEYDAAFPDKLLVATYKDPATNQFNPHWQSWRYDHYPAGSPAPGAVHHIYRVRADGQALATFVTYTYDSIGRRLSETDAEGGRTDYSYDSAGNVVMVTRPSNNVQGVRPVEHYAYDQIGQLTSFTNALGAVTTYSYDALGRLLTMTLPDPSLGSSLVFTYTNGYDDFDAASGLLYESRMEPGGGTILRARDEHGRLREDIDELGSKTVYSYTRSLLSAITDANGNVTTYLHDGRRRRTGLVAPDGSQESYAYTPDGHVGQFLDRRGQVTTYSFDRLKRLVAKAYAGGSITFTYQGQKRIGIVDTTTAPTETHTYSYDDLYRPSSITQGARGVLGYSYTATDQVASYSVLNGPATVYSHHPDGSLRSIEWSAISGQFEYTYTLSGDVDTISFPNGQIWTYGYDLQRRLLSLSTEHPGAGTLASYQLGYDIDHYTGAATKLGWTTSMTATVPSQGLNGALSRYYYDAGARLTRVDYPTTAPFSGAIEEWTYDDVGNRLTSAVNGQVRPYSYSHNGANPKNSQRLSTDGISVFAYDSNGNLASQASAAAVHELVWNDRDRLVGVVGSAAVEYGYDFFERRVSRVEGGGATSFLYDRLHLIASSGSAQSNYLFGAELDRPLAMERDGEVFFYVLDAFGSVAAIVDATGALVRSYVFDAWGGLRGQSGSLPNEFGYTGREFAGAEMRFHRARYYMPALGRFVQEDPMGLFRDELNVYRYAANAPVVFRDSTGLEYSRFIRPVIYNEDPTPYCGCGEKDPKHPNDKPPVPILIPTQPRRPADEPDHPQDPSVPPDWDVDFICIGGKWVKVRFGHVVIRRGRALGLPGAVQPPPNNWTPPWPCPGPCGVR